MSRTGTVTALRVRLIESLPPPLRRRVRRLWLSLVPIFQCALAAGAAWWAAIHIFGHPQPFFAPIAAVISLGLSLSMRWRRSLELMIGVTVGILVGDILIAQIGSGTWQIMVVVALAMAVAVFVDNGPLVPIQAASSAVLVATLLPPGGLEGFNRAVDAAVGGLIGLVVGATVPVNPAHRPRRNAAVVLAKMRDLSRDLAAGLRDADPIALETVLAEARGTQGSVEAMRADMRGSREVTTISPLHWSSRDRIDRIAATADPIDNAVRNFRVIARRAHSLTLRGDEVLPEIIEIIADLSGAFEILREMMLADVGDEPDEADAARVLRSITRKARADLIDEKSPLSEAALLAELRSLLVDLLMVAGLRRASAVATLR